MENGEKKYGPNLPLPFREIGGEKLLQFIWQFGYFNSSNLRTTEGEPLSVISPGTLNRDGGPDFTGAKIKIGETTFFGNVELHLKTSDWEKHNHQNDPAYRNVILHVVFQHEKELHNQVPVVELEPRVSNLLLERYFALMNAETFIPCHTSLASVKDLVWVAWKERLLVERLTRKTRNILLTLQESNNHWEEVLWWLLARNFGMKVNSDAFEAIARTLPITVLAKHKSSIHQIEALLFGQAGLLQGSLEEDYPKLLQREYNFLCKKLSLQSVKIPLQFLRMRPVAFPTVRLAQLAVLIHQSTHLFSKIIEAKGVEDVQKLLQVTANDFWHYHYTFEQTAAFKEKSLGSDTINNIIINTVVPMLFSYGVHHSEENVKDKALRFLESVVAEKNNITKSFSLLGVKAGTAYDSQALVELKNEYCSKKRCLQCAAGNYLLKRDNLQAVISLKPTSR